MLRRWDVSFVPQKYYRGMRDRRRAAQMRSMARSAQEEAERAARAALMRERGLARKALVQQATDVLLALQAQAQYERTRSRMMDPRGSHPGGGGRSFEAEAAWLRGSRFMIQAREHGTIKHPLSSAHTCIMGARA